LDQPEGSEDRETLPSKLLEVLFVYGFQAVLKPADEEEGVLVSIVDRSL
jgi:hypothetical protein